ncbi:MAG: DNA mismatch repair endonuclease MutL [Oscillospiraceae bacterium]|nr:DNA mismatch repair endonuclease MutL [Oscillospiraceae bacterium]
MPQIQVLSPHVADMIAAGEVVERPASIIKELMENAFDAGAKQVRVEIEDGGATMIRVTDDGCGMAAEDAGIAFLRHATSKLKDEYGLEAIRTMGFRGEALAAISAVSRIELTTRRPEDTEGTFLQLAAGEIEEMESTGCPAGTSICVRDLFYNTPARLKFLKSDRSEAAACVQAGLRCALGRPEISVRFLRGGREEFFTPGDGSGEACCYALLGREEASGLLPVKASEEGLSVTGFVSSPAAGHGNRSSQYFFVNGRFIRSVLLQTALEQAYRNRLLVGRYPACVIWLEIRPGAVDVNVHPAKTEVKFSEERRVFSLLYQAAMAGLEQEDRIQAGPELTAPKTERTETPSAAVPAGSAISAAAAAERPEAQAAVKPEEPRAFQQSFFAAPPAPYRSAETRPTASGEAYARPERGAGSPLPAEEKAPVQEHGDGAAETPEISSREEAAPAVPEHKILGEAFRTYILVEVGDEMILIDKHAAHERMNFDRMRARHQPLASQQLLTPQTLRLDQEELELISRYGELFADFGYELEPFGERELILRAVPADILPEDARPSLEEILEHLKNGGTPDPASARDELLHTVACKAAIKAGWKTGWAELERIAVEVLSGRVKYCPHGRPVSIRVTRRDLDRLFKRIV